MSHVTHDGANVSDETSALFARLRVELDVDGERLAAAKRERTKRDRARSLAKQAQKDGRLIPKPCEQCGNPKAEKHHDDYGRPLDVRWLCKSCHQHWHRQHPETRPPWAPRQRTPEATCGWLINGERCGEGCRKGNRYCAKHRAEYMRLWRRAHKAARANRRPLPILGKRFALDLADTLASVREVVGRH